MSMKSRENSLRDGNEWGQTADRNPRKKRKNNFKSHKITVTVTSVLSIFKESVCIRNKEVLESPIFVFKFRGHRHLE